MSDVTQDESNKHEEKADHEERIISVKSHKKM